MQHHDRLENVKDLAETLKGSKEFERRMIAQALVDLAEEIESIKQYLEIDRKPNGWGERQAS